VILGRPAWNRAEEALRPDPGSPVPALLAHIRAGWREGDGIFVYDGAQYVFEYYAPRFGFEPVDSIVGVSERKVPERFLPQLEELRRYRRVWILFAHVWRSDHFSTVQWFLHRLNRMGRLRGSLELKRASVFLYDLEGRDAGPSPPSGQ
jgi:hypothetical protein